MDKMITRIIFVSALCAACTAASWSSNSLTKGTSTRYAAQNAPTRHTGEYEPTSQRNHQASTRMRRWILTWMLTHGALMDHINKTIESQDAEIHDLPRAGDALQDLSGDTRVNYLASNGGRAGSLARESDAEVFDWELLQEDRHRNQAAGNLSGSRSQGLTNMQYRTRNEENFGVNPHYYAFNNPTDDKKSEYTDLYDRPYGVRERTAVGFIGANSNTRTPLVPETRRPAVEASRSAPATRRGVYKFRRTPIAFEESLEYQRTRTSNGSSRT